MSEYARPQALRAGDTVALVAPAGPVPAELLEAALPMLHEWGLAVRIGPCVRRRHPQLRYLADTDRARAAEFSDAWLDPEVSAIFAARGGYGSVRMLDHLDWDALAQARPKLFAGSSDVTALHEAIGRHLRLSTVFCPMPATTYFDATARDHVRRTVFEPGSTTVLARRGESACLAAGTARGTLVGGNLSVLASTVGAGGHQAEPGALAILEDVDEDVYRLDRMLTQLLRSGWFTDVAGVVLGSWIGCGRLDDIRTLMLDRLGPLDVPMLWQLGFGHLPGALTVPLGVPAELEAHTGRLALTQPALESRANS